VDEFVMEWLVWICIFCLDPDLAKCSEYP